MPPWALQMSYWAGVGTWLVVGVPVVLQWAQKPALFAQPGNYLWLACYLLFGLIFALVASDRLSFLPNTRRTAMIVLGVQVFLASCALLLLPQYGFIAVLFIITAAHAPHVLRLPQAVALVLAQTALMAVTFSRVGGWDDGLAIAVSVFAYLGFQLFALFSTEAALREARARAELSQLNAELKATQALLSESSRVGERVRIARELHDLIGHQLTALALNLEIATHTEGQKSREHVEKAQQIAKELLGGVRSVVSAMRDTPIDLEASLRALVEGVPKPAIHLALEPGVSLGDPERAHALVRCVQEVITNAVRHAQADNLWIRLEATPEGLAVHARDDGRGVREVRAGNGLRGMRERLEQLGGRLQVQSRPGEGFSIDAVIPS